MLKVRFHLSRPRDWPLTAASTGFEVSTSTLGTSLGTGGMETKIIAAELATGAGVTTVILNTHQISSIFPIISSTETTEEASLPQHTRFLAKENPLGE